MFGQSNIFYHNTLRRAVATFGTLFNDIYMKRFNSDGTEKERFKIPLSYSAKQKFIQKIKPQNGQIKMLLPRIGFEMTNMTYDPTRKTNTLQKRYNYESDTSFSFRHERVPYDIDFSLYIATKNIDDGLQIIDVDNPSFVFVKHIENAFLFENIKREFSTIRSFRIFESADRQLTITIPMGNYRRSAMAIVHMQAAEFLNATTLEAQVSHV